MQAPWSQRPIAWHVAALALMRSVSCVTFGCGHCHPPTTPSRLCQQANPCLRLSVLQLHPGVWTCLKLSNLTMRGMLCSTRWVSVACRLHSHWRRGAGMYHLRRLLHWRHMQRFQPLRLVSAAIVHRHSLMGSVPCCRFQQTSTSSSLPGPDPRRQRLAAV